ncbi:hypothetical protein [Kibdelosporangium philippinense]|uniref:hypothetical protein n=1 Tax=Kibdelosporangium philippinense TaxID=211113 RepID=UPI0036079571
MPRAASLSWTRTAVFYTAVFSSCTTRTGWKPNHLERTGSADQLRRSWMRRQQLYEFVRQTGCSP